MGAQAELLQPGCNILLFPSAHVAWPGATSCAQGPRVEAQEQRPQQPGRAGAGPVASSSASARGTAPPGAGTPRAEDGHPLRLWPWLKQKMA
mmetsp:Transcript_54171/g.161418  ORF Transcript_54171/g.161418 Transcript_54171/m.161418 type:complete len:92 (-) Transcript_54171:2-277(-)